MLCIQYNTIQNVWWLHTVLLYMMLHKRHEILMWVFFIAFYLYFLRFFSHVLVNKIFSTWIKKIWYPSASFGHVNFCNNRMGISIWMGAKWNKNGENKWRTLMRIKIRPRAHTHQPIPSHLVDLSLNQPTENRLKKWQKSQLSKFIADFHFVVYMKTLSSVKFFAGRWLLTHTFLC